MKKLWIGIALLAAMLIGGCNQQEQNIRAGTKAYVAFQVARCQAIEDATDKLSCDEQLEKARLYTRAVLLWMDGESLDLTELAYEVAMKHADEDEKPYLIAVHSYIEALIEMQGLEK